MFFLINYLFLIKWLDMITTPILYKCIMTIYLIMIIYFIELIIYILLPSKDKNNNILFTEYYQSKFLVTSIIGWIKLLLFFLWFLYNSTLNNIEMKIDSLAN